ncbi:MAG: hypothetical protein WBK96_03430 [Candidatus Manganitrophaceae bacterium]
MRNKRFLSGGALSAICFGGGACGVPETEHEKVVRELDRLSHEKSALSNEFTQRILDQKILSGRISELENKEGPS